MVVFMVISDLRIKIITGILFVHQPVQIIADALQVDQPDTFYLSSSAQRDRLDVPFLDQVVNRSAFEPEQSLHVLEPTELWHDIGAVSESNGFGGEAVVVRFVDVLFEPADACLWFHGKKIKTDNMRKTSPECNMEYLVRSNT